ncbi:MAG: 50S ribosomal protein L23 [Nanoarchaeota archaeon]
MLLKPVTSEKAVRMIEGENTLVFALDRRETKEEIKKEVEKTFNVKVERVNVINKKNEKHALVKLKKDFKAIDVATKLGMI